MRSIKIFLSVITGAIFLVSCLKDSGNNFANTASPAPNGVMFLNVNSAGYTTNVQTLGAVSSSMATTFTFYVQLSSSNGAYPATSVSIDTAAVNVFNYNNNNGTSLSILPDSAFTLVNKTATVDPATHLAAFQITLNATKVDLTQSYALGVSLLSASNSAVTVASNTTYSTKVILITIKNPYDATYACTGYFFHPTAPRAINKSVAISTITGITSQTDVGDLGGSGYQFNFDTDPVANTISNWSAQNATPVQPASGFMTKDNPAKIATYPGSTTGFVSSTYNNTYDPVNMIFWMHYGYGVGSTGQVGYTRQVYEQCVRQ